MQFATQKQLIMGKLQYERQIRDGNAVLTVPALTPEIIRHIAGFATPIACQMTVGNCYSSNSGLQLDANAYDQDTKYVVKRVDYLIDEYYVMHNSSFSYNIYDDIHAALRIPWKESLACIEKWIERKEANDDEEETYFTLLQKHYLQERRGIFIAEMVDADESDEE